VKTPDFIIGDSVTFKQIGRVVDVNAENVTVEAGGVRHVLDADSATDELTLRNPSGWSPLPGDIWTMDGRLWFAWKRDGFVTLLSAEGHNLSPADLNLPDNKRRLRLIWRDGQPVSAPEQDDAPVDEIAQALSAADVEINGGDYPRWCDLRDGGQDQYRAAARYALARYRITPREQQDGGESRG